MVSHCKTLLSLCGLCCSVPVQLLTGKDMVSSGVGCMHSLSLPLGSHHLKNGGLLPGMCTMMMCWRHGYHVCYQASGQQIFVNIPEIYIPILRVLFPLLPFVQPKHEFTKNKILLKKIPNSHLHNKICVTTILSVHSFTFMWNTVAWNFCGI